MKTNLVVGNLTALIANDNFAEAMRRLRHTHGWFYTMHEIARNTDYGRSSLVFLAREGELIVGQMIVDPALRSGIFIDPEYRRQGYGSMLLQRAYEQVGSGLVCSPDDDGGIKFFREHELSLRLIIHILS